MPGSIHISAIQPPLTTSVFLQVSVGKREYSGNIGQDDFYFPVTSLRDSMVMALYNAEKELISKTEVKTRTIVELGTTDVVFILHSGGEIILQLQFLLSDEGRKRIQELRNSVMKRKQQELLGNASELYLQENSLSKQHAENVSNIPSKGDQRTLQKSVSLDDLKQRAVFPGISVDPHMKVSRDLLLQSDENTSKLKDDIDSKLGHGKTESRSSNNLKLEDDIDSKSGHGEPESRSSNNLKLEDVIDSKSGHGKPESRSSNSLKLEDDIDSKLGHDKPESRSSNNAVKKMITAFESSSPQGPPSMTRIKPESSLEGMSVSSETSTNSSYKPSTSGASSQTGIVAGTADKASLPSQTGIVAGTPDKASLPSQTGIVAETPAKASLPSGDSIGPSSRSVRHDDAFGNKKSNASKSNAYESRRRSSSRRDGAAKVSAGEKELIRSKKRSQEKHRRSIVSCSLAQTHSVGLSTYYLHHPLNYLVATSSMWIHPHVCMTTASKQLRELVELEKLNPVCEGLDVREDTKELQGRSDGEARSMTACNRRLTDGFAVQNGWLINQGVRAVIVVIACGAVFLNNR